MAPPRKVCLWSGTTSCSSKWTADTKPVTGRTGAEGIVERKQSWFDLIDREARLGQAKLAENTVLSPLSASSAASPSVSASAVSREIGKTCRQFVRIALDHKAVDNKLDIMFALLVEFGRGIQIIDLAINPHPAKAFAMIIGQFLAVFPLRPLITGARR